MFNFADSWMQAEYYYGSLVHTDSTTEIVMPYGLQARPVLYHQSAHYNCLKRSFPIKGSSWTWSYGKCSWILNYLCNQCLSPLTFWVRILQRRGVLDTTLCDEVCQWLVTGRWFSVGTPVSSTNINWPSRLNWNIVESDIKTHKPQKDLHEYFVTVISITIDPVPHI
jgi:hypothetical protein